jgi:molybdopterin synthase sulfur carrier subunit
MLIRARFFGDLSRYLDKKWMTIEVPQGSSLSDLISNIDDSVGSNVFEKLIERNELRSGFRILVNGRNINYLNRLDTKLSDGDLVTIMPIAGGG